MKRLLTVLGFLALAAPAAAQRVVDENGTTLHLYPDRSKVLSVRPDDAGPGRRTQNLINHGGPVLASAKVVSIFWGPSWGNPSNQTLGTTAAHITGFFANFGSTGEYRTIVQYGISASTNLTNQYWIDANNPPNVAVTDSDVQAEVLNYIAQHGGAPDPSTVYEVFIPNGYYAKSGSATSCGGPNLQFCAYHGHFSSGGNDIKYASMPYPSCSGCQWPGFTVEQNFDHFSCHETREAATDPDLNAWYDRQGNEADDKCAWSPAPFIDAGFGYQWEWSNADRGCVQTK